MEENIGLKLKLDEELEEVKGWTYLARSASRNYYMKLMTLKHFSQENRSSIAIKIHNEIWWKGSDFDGSCKFAMIDV